MEKGNREGNGRYDEPDERFGRKGLGNARYLRRKEKEKESERADWEERSRGKNKEIKEIRKKLEKLKVRGVSEVEMSI